MNKRSRQDVFKLERNLIMENFTPIERLESYLKNMVFVCLSVPMRCINHF